LVILIRPVITIPFTYHAHFVGIDNWEDHHMYFTTGNLNIKLISQ